MYSHGAVKVSSAAFGRQTSVFAGTGMCALKSGDGGKVGRVGGLGKFLWDHFGVEVVIVGIWAWWEGRSGRIAECEVVGQGFKVL